MCIYCNEHEALEPEACCPACLVRYRIEVASGLRQLGDYMERWAAFQDWCSAREQTPVAA